MRIEEKERNLCRVKVGALRYCRKWGCLGRGFLTGFNHMARGAPPFNHRFSVVWIGRKSGAGEGRDGSGGKKYFPHDQGAFPLVIAISGKS